MKKLLLILLLLLSLYSTAQVNEMQGMWVSKTSSYVTTILSKEDKVIEVYRTSFAKHKVVDEKIVEYLDESFTTELYNPKNNYRVNVRYTFKDINTLVCYYSGSLEKAIIMKRVKIIIK